MTDQDHNQPTGWDENASQDFLNYGNVFIPYRDLQLQLLTDLVPAISSPFRILDLCCGDGLLGSSLLARYPQAVWIGLDGSPAMLERAAQQLAGFGDRVDLRTFDLRETGWRRGNLPYQGPFQAVVSSMAIHHLDADEKRQLYMDLLSLLAPGGVLGIADIIQPVGEAAVDLAARQWDEAVRQRSLELEGNLRLAEAFFQERWNTFRFADPIDKPSPLLDQLRWLEGAGFGEVNVFWLYAGHAVFGGRKPGGRRLGGQGPGGQGPDGRRADGG